MLLVLTLWGCVSLLYLLMHVGALLSDMIRVREILKFKNNYVSRIKKMREKKICVRNTDVLISLRLLISLQY